MTVRPLYDAMCVGAHPDDVEIGMGASIAGMVRRGLNVVIVDLTNGEPTPFGTPERRAAESAESARILGAERRTLTQANRYLLDTVQARVELAEVIREFRPRNLFVPYAEDTHPDHIAASAIAVAARFYAKFTKTEMHGEPFFPGRIYRYMAVHMRVIAAPSFIVDVTEDLPTKLTALRAYSSQFAENPANIGIVDLMQQQAAMWGAFGRVSAGEPFFSLEPVALAGFDDLR